MLGIEITLYFHMPCMSTDIDQATGAVDLRQRSHNILGQSQCVVFDGRDNLVESR